MKTQLVRFSETKKDPSPQKGRVGRGRGRETLTGDSGQIACPVGACGSRTHLDPTAVIAKSYFLAVPASANLRHVSTTVSGFSNMV